MRLQACLTYYHKIYSHVLSMHGTWAVCPQDIFPCTFYARHLGRLPSYTSHSPFSLPDLTLSSGPRLSQTHRGFDTRTHLPHPS